MFFFCVSHIHNTSLIKSGIDQTKIDGQSKANVSNKNNNDIVLSLFILKTEKN